MTCQNANRRRHTSDFADGPIAKNAGEFFIRQWLPVHFDTHESGCCVIRWWRRRATSLLKKLRGNGRMIAEARGSLSAVAAELIGGIRTVTEFGAQPYEAAKFAVISEQSRRENIRAFVRSGAVGPLSQAIAATILVGLVIMAVKTLVAPGVMTASALLAFLVVL